MYITDGSPNTHLHLSLFSQRIGEINLHGVELVFSQSVLFLRYRATLRTIREILVILGIEGTVTSVSAVVEVQVGGKLHP